MAGTSRRYDPRTTAKYHQNADRNPGSDDGCVGGAEQITEPDDRVASNVGKAKILAQLRRRQLADLLQKSFCTGDQKFSEL